MNVRLLKRVRDTIARSRTKWRFDMNAWLVITNGDESYVYDMDALSSSIDKIRTKECGTVGCIAGWTVVEGYDKLRRLRTEFAPYADIGDFARRLLGLDVYDASYLFYGQWAGRDFDLERITKREALDYLDECIAAKKIVRRPL
jgi:hypothetical protein